MSEEKISLRRSPDISAKEMPKYPTDTVQLSTKGWFYPENSPLASGEVELKQMSAREEDILANQDLIKKGKVLNKLLESLMVDKSIDIKQILITDLDSIFMSIRRLAYGDSYPVGITCPSCGSKSKIDIDLSQIEEKDIDVEQFPKGINSFSFTFPKSQFTITYKLLNTYDDDDIERELKGLRKIDKNNVPEVTTRLKYTITSIDGNDDKKYIRKFIEEELLAIDSRALREHISNNTPGMDMKFDFECDNCDLERRLSIPMGASFLWPDIEA